MLDVQVDADNEIEGAWLATGPSQSPRMVLLGQQFGPGILRRARMDMKTNLPEVWMQNADGTCRASLGEADLARTLLTKLHTTQTGPAREPPPAASTPTASSVRHTQIERAHRNVQRLTRALFAASPKPRQDGAESSTTLEAEPTPTQGGAAASAP